MKEQYKIFCDTYIKTFNASESYLTAFPGVKTSTAMVNGCRLLKKEEIQEYLKQRYKEASNERIADAQEVLETLTRTMRQQEEEEVVVTEMIGNGLSESKIIKKKPNLAQVLRAAELLGKRYALFTDKVEVDGKASITIVDDIGALEDEEED